MKHVLRYRITIPWHKGISDFMDMFRYSDDWVEEIESRKVYILRHFLQHRQRGKAFFHKQIKGRWESFGAEVKLLDEVYATEFDKTYRYEKDVIPIIEGRTKYNVDRLKEETHRTFLPAPTNCGECLKLHGELICRDKTRCNYGLKQTPTTAASADQRKRN